MDAIEIFKVSTKNENYFIGKIIKNNNYYLLEKEVDQYEKEHGGLAQYIFDISLIDKVTRIVYEFPNVFYIYSGDALLFKVVANEFTIQYEP